MLKRGNKAIMAVHYRRIRATANNIWCCNTNKSGEITFMEGAVRLWRWNCCLTEERKENHPSWYKWINKSCRDFQNIMAIRVENGSNFRVARDIHVKCKINVGGDYARAEKSNLLWDIFKDSNLFHIIISTKSYAK